VESLAPRPLREFAHRESGYLRSVAGLGDRGGC
jgi:hypothetical protein